MHGTSLLIALVIGRPALLFEQIGRVVQAERAQGEESGVSAHEKVRRRELRSLLDVAGRG